MRQFLSLLALLATPALAQVPPAELGQRNVPAPWWMREPVIASMGMVQTELPANRAQLGARFGAVAKTAAEASSAASKKVRELDESLRAIGSDKMRLTTTFNTRPLYEQYRQKDGALVDNERADKIDSYEVTARLAVSVRDVAVLERAYRLIIAAKPTAVDPIGFSLEPENTTKTWLQTEAVKDAARRARQAVEAAGGRLGTAKVIDPSGGVCETQVLAGWPSYGSSTLPTDVQSPTFASPPPSPAPVAFARSGAPTLEQQADAVQVTLQPPIEKLSDKSCVIYGLLP